eukprot:4546733-Pyramimonas_sp.AAC.1
MRPIFASLASESRNAPLEIALDLLADATEAQAGAPRIGPRSRRQGHLVKKSSAHSWVGTNSRRWF